MASNQIRKRSLKAASWIYVGFLIGALNTYFFTHKDWFSLDEYGLTRSVLDVSLLISGISTLGVTSFLFKFFPYYRDNVENKRNDMLSLALCVAGIGFLVTSLSVWLFQPLIQRKLETNSPLLVEYIYYCIPLAGLILLYSILEAYSYGFHKGVFTSFLRELVVRLFTLVAILLKVFGWIDFQQFMLLFALQYVSIVIILIAVLKKEGNLWLHFKQSKVTRKYRKKIFAIMTLTFFVIVVTVLRQAIDSLVIAAKISLEKVGIFGFAAYLVSVLQAPFRSMVAITIPILSTSWKQKNMKEISRIYKRSSINLLCFALLIFGCILMNYDTAINYFKLNPQYLEGKWVFFTLGIVTIIEMGTGVNGQIIGTSSYWRFELWTSLLLTLLIIPLSYLLTVEYGMIGPALANLISFSIYNSIRIWFLWKKFRLQPFSKKTYEVIIVFIAVYAGTYYALQNLTGLLSLIVRTSLFGVAMAALIYWRNISPDVKPVIDSVKKRFFIN